MAAAPWRYQWLHTTQNSSAGAVCSHAKAAARAVTPLGGEKVRGCKSTRLNETNPGDRGLNRAQWVRAVCSTSCANFSAAGSCHHGS